MADTGPICCPISAEIDPRSIFLPAKISMTLLANQIALYYNTAEIIQAY